MSRIGLIQEKFIRSHKHLRKLQMCLKGTEVGLFQFLFSHKSAENVHRKWEHNCGILLCRNVY